MKDDAVELCSFGKLVPPSVRAEAQLIVQKIKSDKLTIFKGPYFLQRTAKASREGHARSALLKRWSLTT